MGDNMAFASLQDIQYIIAQNFFGGDTGIAGIVMYATVMAVVFILFAQKNLAICFALMLPTSFVFTTMSILPESMTILLIIIAIIGLAKELRDTVN